MKIDPLDIHSKDRVADLTKLQEEIDKAIAIDESLVGHNKTETAAEVRLRIKAVLKAKGEE